MATYPNGIYEPREIENRPEASYDPNKKRVFYAEDHNKTNDEIVAIETELGLNPRGEYADVAANLAALWAALEEFATSFLELTDTPDSYEGQGGKIVKVKADETGLEFGEAAGGGGNKIKAEIRFLSIYCDTSEREVFSETIAGGTLGTSNGIFCDIQYCRFIVDTSAKTVTLRFKYGGSTIASVIFTSSANFYNMKGHIRCYLCAHDSANAQDGLIEALFADTATLKSLALNSDVGNLTIDSSQNQTLSLTAQTNDSYGQLDFYTEFIHLLS